MVCERNQRRDARLIQPASRLNKGTAMQIVLTPNDRRIGTMQNGETAWPEVNVFGAAYERHNASIYSLDGVRFVVIPPNRWHEIEGAIVALEPPIVEGDTPIMGTAANADSKK